MTAVIETAASATGTDTVSDANTPAQKVEAILRLGAAACFIGHGAFGILTKDAWLPYFAVVGIGRETAYQVMPLVGSIDVAAGLLVLVSPRPVVLLYMTIWGLWTALLR